MKMKTFLKSNSILNNKMGKKRKPVSVLTIIIVLLALVFGASQLGLLATPLTDIAIIENQAGNLVFGECDDIIHRVVGQPPEWAILSAKPRFDGAFAIIVDGKIMKRELGGVAWQCPSVTGDWSGVDRSACRIDSPAFSTTWFDFVTRNPKVGLLPGEPVITLPVQNAPTCALSVGTHKVTLLMESKHPGEPFDGFGIYRGTWNIKILPKFIPTPEVVAEAPVTVPVVTPVAEKPVVTEPVSFDEELTPSPEVVEPTVPFFERFDMGIMLTVILFVFGAVLAAMNTSQLRKGFDRALRRKK